MLREKSCGVVPFHEVDGEIRYLVISSAVTKREHWEFPKGGVEEGEREIETALRELREETGVSDVELVPGYREPIRYIYRRAEGLVFKQVVYFLGRVKDPRITPRQEEVKDYRWATFEEAKALLRHGNARELLMRSHAFLTGQPLPPRRAGKKRRPSSRKSSGPRPPARGAPRRDAAGAGAPGPRPRMGAPREGERTATARGTGEAGPAMKAARLDRPPAPNGGGMQGERRRRRRRRRRRPPKPPTTD